MNNIFLCDIDGVLADTHTAWLALYNIESGDTLTPDRITDWNIQNFVFPDWKDRIWEVFEDPKLYDYVLPIPGALEGISRIRQSGWRVVFVTSPSNSENPMRRFAWLKLHGFATSMKDFVVARDKTLMRAEMMIDDSPKNVASFPGIAVLLDQPWNRSYDWNRRAKDWNEVLKMVNC